MKSYKVFGVIAGLCYLIWWWSFLFFLPLNYLKTDYSILINSPAWFPINLLEVIAIISFMLFFIEVKNNYKKNIVMDILQFVGFFCFCAVAFYETFLWPIIAKESPALLNVVNGPIYTSNYFLISTSIAILSFMISNIFLELKLINVFP